MSIEEIKSLFFQATNVKILMAGDPKVSENLLREAIKLSDASDDSIWPRVSAYRLAHLLFRNAKDAEQLNEIQELAEYSENTNSKFLKLHSNLIKFAAVDRSRRLGIGDFEQKLLDIQREIIKIVGELHLRSRDGANLESGARPIQDSYFNLLEFMTYMAGIDYSSMVGIGYDENNKLFIDGTHDLWRIVGNDGFADQFSYNKEIGFIELQRIVKQKNAIGWYILGTSGNGNELHRSTDAKCQNSTDRIKILNHIIRSGQTGVAVSELTARVFPTNQDTEMVKKHRQNIVRYFGQEVFSMKKHSNNTYWAKTDDSKIFGLVNQKELR